MYGPFVDSGTSSIPPESDGLSVAGDINRPVAPTYGTSTAFGRKSIWEPTGLAKGLAPAFGKATRKDAFLAVLLPDSIDRPREPAIPLRFGGGEKGQLLRIPSRYQP
jgi:hypothetical protein